MAIEVNLQTVAEITPLLYLTFFIFIDKHLDINLKFFHYAIERVKEKVEDIRQNCPAFQVPDLICPIYSSIHDNEYISKEKLRDIPNNSIFWTQIKEGFTIQSQSAFFEVLSFQFLIVAIILSINNKNNITPTLLAFGLFFFFFVVLLIIVTYGERKSSSIYTNINQRVLLLIFSAVIIWVLLGYEFPSLIIFSGSH